MILRRESGSTLTEVVVVAAILSVVSLAFLGTYSILSQFHEKNTLSIKAELLAEEGIEALRFIKSGGWSNLSAIPAGTPRYLALSADSWSATTTPEVIDGKFYRSFQVSPVSRDELYDDIVANGGVVDPDTLLISVSVSFGHKGATTTASYQAYITNI